MLLSDNEIAAREMIIPFVEQYPHGCLSYGLTSAGYDLRLDNSIWVFKNTYAEIVDPKRFKDPDYLSSVFDIRSVPFGDPIVIPARSYVLGQSYETIRMPIDLKGRCVGKSTYARCGIIVNTTPLEPGWFGKLTIEISNSNPCPVRLYTGEGIAQLEFEQLSSPCFKSYADKKGKYQGQTSVTPARMQ
jgi:dCTP deaminase